MLFEVTDKYTSTPTSTPTSNTIRMGPPLQITQALINFKPYNKPDDVYKAAGCFLGINRWDTVITTSTTFAKPYDSPVTFDNPYETSATSP